MTLPWELRNIIMWLVTLHSDYIIALHNAETAFNTFKKR